MRCYWLQGRASSSGSFARGASTSAAQVVTASVMIAIVGVGAAADDPPCGRTWCWRRALRRAARWGGAVGIGGGGPVSEHRDAASRSRRLIPGDPGRPDRGWDELLLAYSPASLSPCAGGDGFAP